MAEVLELRRVSCVRDFPKGCGPDAVLFDQEPTVSEPPQLLLPPSEPSVSESTEINTGTAQVPSLEADDSLCTRTPITETSRLGCLEKQVMDSSKTRSGNTAATGVNQEEADQIMQSSSNHDGRLGLPSVLENGLERSKESEVPITDASSLSDGYLEGQWSSKMYPPPLRRAASAIRDFPIGCGVISPRSGCGQESTLAPAASSKVIPPVKEKHSILDQRPVHLKDVASSEKNPNNTVKAMEERIVAWKIKEDRVTAEASKSLFPTRNSKEAANKPLVEKVGIARETKETRLHARAAPDARLTGKAIVPFGNKPGSQMANKASSLKSTAKLLVESHKASKNMKREFSDTTKHAGFAGIEKKLEGKNLEAHGKRLLIQALAAAPNCPWRQGRKSKHFKLS